MGRCSTPLFLHKGTEFSLCAWLCLLLLVSRSRAPTPLHYSAICLPPAEMPAANPRHLAATHCPGRSLGGRVTAAYLGSDSSVRPSGSQRSRKSAACNYWSPHGPPWGKSDSSASCCSWGIHQGDQTNTTEVQGHGLEPPALQHQNTPLVISLFLLPEVLPFPSVDMQH